MFQSRNRDTCLFKGDAPLIETDGQPCFNLVIEILVFSSVEDLQETVEILQSFNLVIEILVFSSVTTVAQTPVVLFVSIS